MIDPIVWWIGQFLHFILRPQPSVKQMLDKYAEEMHFDKPIVGYVTLYLYIKFIPYEGYLYIIDIKPGCFRSQSTSDVQNKYSRFSTT